MTAEEMAALRDKLAQFLRRGAEDCEEEILVEGPVGSAMGLEPDELAVIYDGTEVVLTITPS